MTTKYYYVPDSKGKREEQETSAKEVPHMISYLCHVPGKLSFTVTATNVKSADIIQY